MACPISAMAQMLIVILVLLLACHAVMIRALKCSFEPKNVTMNMYDTISVNYTIDDPGGQDLSSLQIYAQDGNVAQVDHEYYIAHTPVSSKKSFNLTGVFLGQTKVVCKVNNQTAEGELKVVVTRKKRVIDSIFTASVITLVSIIYINFGCALNWGELRRNLKRPIGPAIGFVGQFIFMPLLSFLIGKLLFPENPEMQLGMFFTGVSPAGGASNVWTVILDGNVDLSITMTTISNIAAFGMMPLWIFTLGRLIFERANLEVPYQHIASYAVALVIPLGIGYLMTRYCKKVANFMARILKGLSSLLILFIIIFAIVTNLYMFQLFSWQIVIAGMGLPYLGFLSAFVLAKALRQPPPDCLAISIETGIQNTGIAIFLLRVALQQPQADLTTVAPVAVAVMTPFPLIIMFIVKKLRAKISPDQRKLSMNAESSKSMIDNNFNNSSTGEENKISTISSNNQ